MDLSVLEKCIPCRAAESEPAALARITRGRFPFKTARDIDLKKAGVIALSGIAALTAAGIVSRRLIYRGAVSRELRRQLAPLNKKLDELAMQNELLRDEVERLTAAQEADKTQPEAEA